MFTLATAIAVRPAELVQPVVKLGVGGGERSAQRLVAARLGSRRQHIHVIHHALDLLQERSRLPFI
jgi:hypothetical protein